VLENESLHREWIDADVDLSFAAARWRKLVRRSHGDGAPTNRRYLELCVLSYMAEELRVGDLCVCGSDAYADYRDHLLKRSTVAPTIPIAASMKPITREQVVVAKRAAMEMSFWTACALDDDNGFDRLLRMQHLDELDNPEWGGIFLCEHLRALNFGIERIKDIVFRDAVRLCNLCGATLDIAVTLLQRTRSTEVPDGIYTAERYRDVHFSFELTQPIDPN
jgi:hypothetical protein